MNMIGALVGGMLGGLIGAVAWAAVTYYSGWEIGLIAWGIGGLVGLGVYLGTRRRGGIAAGGTAAILALAAVLVGKGAVVWIAFSTILADDEPPVSSIADVVVTEREEAGHPVRLPPEDQAETLRDMYPPEIWNEAVQRWEAMDPQEQEAIRVLPMMANPQFWLVWLADEVVGEYEEDDRDVNWPPGMDFDSAWREAHYPPEIWAEAIERWDAIPLGQEAFKASVIEDMRQGMTLVKQEMLLQSLTLYDLLWAGLAVVTAAKVGAGGPVVPAPVGEEPDSPDP